MPEPTFHPNLTSPPCYPIPMSDTIDHDTLFKELLTTFFEDFIQLFFPTLHPQAQPA